MRRRELLWSLGALALVACGPRARARRRRRRVRRRIRRRIRRRVIWRTVGARRVVVVPVAVAVGWELELDGQVVVVAAVEADALVVVDGAGKRQQVPYVKEDDETNRVEAVGTALDANDTSTPYREDEEEVEEEY